MNEFTTTTDRVNEAVSSIQIMTFLWKTDYAQPTRATEFFDAVVEAHASRGVDVYSVLNYSRFEPDVAAENYITSGKLQRVRRGL